MKRSGLVVVAAIALSLNQNIHNAVYWICVSRASIIAAVSAGLHVEKTFP